MYYKFNYIIFALLLLFYAGCDSRSNIKSDNKTTDKIKEVDGTSLTGAPLSNAKVTIKDSTGNVVATSSTDDYGNFVIGKDELTNNEPFFLKAIKLSSTYEPVVVYSIFDLDKLNDGIKITPISSMVVSVALEGKSLEDAYKNYGKSVNAPSVDDLNNAIDSSFNLLKPLLESRGIKESNPDFLVSGEIEADGTGLDGLCEVIDFSIEEQSSGVSKISIKPKTKSLQNQIPPIEFSATKESLTKKVQSIENEGANNQIQQMADKTKDEHPIVLVFSASSSWGEGTAWAGYNGDIMLVNGSSEPIDGWRIDFISNALDGSSGFWNSDRIIDDKTPLEGYSFKNLSWNSMIPAKGKINIGFNGQGEFKNIIKSVKDATLNGKPILVKYLVDGDEIKRDGSKDKDAGVLKEIKDDGNKPITETIKKEVEKKKKDTNVTKKKKEYEDEEKVKKETDPKYTVLFSASGYTAGDFGASLDIANYNNRYTKYLELSMKIPSGVVLTSGQGCWGSGKCSMDISDDKMIVKLEPWSGTFQGAVQIGFRAGGVLTDDVVMAYVKNSSDDANPQPSKVVYKSSMTKSEYRDFIKQKQKEIVKNKKTTTTKKELTKEQPDKNTPPPVVTKHDKGEHFSVAYLISWDWRISGLKNDSSDTAIKKALDIIPDFDYIVYSFAKPDLTSSSTGIDALSPGTKKLIDALHKRGNKVMLAVGGATYHKWAGLADELGKNIDSTVHKKALKKLIEDYGFDGLDVDYEKPGSVEEYKNSILALREVVDSFGGSKELTMAAWSTGADCIASSTFDKNASKYGVCQPGKLSFFGGKAGRERAIFKSLKEDGKNIEDIIDAMSVMAYDGSTNRFDPIELHKHYRELYKGPLAIGIETPTEGWGGAEIVVTHADAKACGVNSMTRGNSYNSKVDPEASYSLERFAKYLVKEDVKRSDITSKIKNGFMLWHATKPLSSKVKCSKAASTQDIVTSINVLIADGNRSNSPLKEDEFKNRKDEDKVKVTTQPAKLPVPEVKKTAITFLSDAEYDKIEEKIIAKDPILVKNIASMITFRDIDSKNWPLKDGLPNFEVDASNLPENVQRIKRVFPESSWKEVFPLASVKVGVKNLNGDTYTYKNFLNAAAFYPKFCNEAWYANGDKITNISELDEICKKELSTMFAHFVQEVGAHGNVYDFENKENINIAEDWKQGLYHVSEAGCTLEGAGCDYRECNLFECADGQKYFGRGAKQLSYNYNYIPFSIVVFKDKDKLKDNPNLVAEDGRLALLSAFYFYMTSRSPKPSIHHVVAGAWRPNAKDKEEGRNLGFGVTIDIVNGGVECGGPNEDIAQSQNRIKYYLAFRNYFGVPVGDIKPNGGVPASSPTTYIYPNSKTFGGEQLGCAHGYKSFADGGSASTPSFWERNWTKDGECKLVSYETKFSAFRKGEYKDCIKYHFVDKNSNK